MGGGQQDHRVVLLAKGRCLVRYLVAVQYLFLSHVDCPCCLHLETAGFFKSSHNIMCGQVQADGRVVYG